MTRIVMQFSKIKSAFKEIRKAWIKFDTDGNGVLDRTELHKCLASLGADLSEAEANEMFDEADIDKSGGLNFREFVVVLALSSVLSFFPIMSMTPGALPSGTTRNPMATAASAAKLASNAQLRAIVESMKILLEAFMLFDENGDGTLQREEVYKVLDERSGHARRHSGVGFGAASFLSKDRWAAMKWDRHGTLTFREFVYAFEDWVGVTDTGVQADEEDELDAAIRPGAASGSAASGGGSDESLDEDDLEEVRVVATGSAARSPVPTPPRLPPPPPADDA